LIDLLVVFSTGVTQKCGCISD